MGRSRSSGPPPTQRGYSPYECISAVQKAIRRSQTDAALYWATELYQSSFGNWLWKRMKVILSEDIGPAAPGLPADVMALDSLRQEFERKDGAKAGLMPTLHAIILMAKAPKSRIVDWAIFVHGGDHKEYRQIPDEAFDMHTLVGKQNGRGIQHFMDEGATLVQPEVAEDPDDDEQETEPSLEVLEYRYREHCQKMADRDPELPYNPWPEGGLALPESDKAAETEKKSDPQERLLP